MGLVLKGLIRLVVATAICMVVGITIAYIFALIEEAKEDNNKKSNINKEMIESLKDLEALRLYLGLGFIVSIGIAVVMVVLCGIGMM